MTRGTVSLDALVQLRADLRRFSEAERRRLERDAELVRNMRVDPADNPLPPDNIGRRASARLRGEKWS